MGLCDFKTESGFEKDLLRKIIDELKLRVHEITQHPRCLAAFAHYLSFFGIYDNEVISSILNEDFIKFTYGKTIKPDLILS